MAIDMADHGSHVLYYTPTSNTFQEGPFGFIVVLVFDFLVCFHLFSSL